MSDPTQDDGVHVVGPDNKHYLFPKGTTPEAIQAHFRPPDVEAATHLSTPGPDTILGGAGRRLLSTVKGVGQLFAPATPEESNIPPAVLIPERIGKGIVEGEKEAGKQYVEQAKAAKSAMASDPVAGTLKAGQAATTGLSMLDPFATGPVTNVNKLDAEGRSKEAIGQGAFDALSLLIGRKTGEQPSAVGKVNKLSYATEAAPKDIAHVLPEFEETAAKMGKAQTVGDFVDHIQKTMTRLDQKFNGALFRNAHRQVVPQDIANELISRANEMPPSVDGQTIAKQLRRAATQYQKPWTLRQLNQERMLRNSYLDAFYKKGEPGQIAAARSSADTMIDKIVADGSRDVLYDQLDKLNPGQDFRELKQKQSSLTDIKKEATRHLDNLEKAQAKFKGAPLSEKAEISASAHTGGVTPRVHGLKRMLPGGGPLVNANKAVRSAAGPSAKATAARSAILSLPVSSLVSGQPTRLPPPPGEGTEQ